jgi:hypothetical protein
VLKNIKSLSPRRLSVTILLFISIGLFFTVLFVAIPSAKVRVWPRMSVVSHTANVVLIKSGAILDFIPKHTLKLVPVKSNINKSLSFDEVSKKFLGEHAETEMTIINEAEEPYQFIGGTRLVNQAGMIFKTKSSVIVPAATALEAGTIKVEAIAQTEDLYGEIIGERGNVPGGLKWEIPGLSLEERKIVYARNSESASGGTSKYGTELRENDIEVATKRIEQELIKTAKIRTEEEIKNLEARTGDEYTLLQYDVLTAETFSGITLPIDLIGKSVKSIPIEGTLIYEMLVYNKDELFDLLLPGLRDHIEDGQELIEDSTSKEGISVHVIEYDDNLSWVKITAELTGKERHVLSAKTLEGREFGERVREAIRGKSVRNAKRIIQNYPEVDRTEVKVWPPWRKVLPSLSSNIVLSSE